MNDHSSAVMAGLNNKTELNMNEWSGVEPFRVIYGFLHVERHYYGIPLFITALP